MATERPNVLWICTDQQRFDTLGCYGNDFVDTPTLDRLAGRGVRFEHCYSQSPVCAPSRASFLTGRYPRTTGCRQNGGSISLDEKLVPRLLSDAGYVCGLAGKLHLAPCHPDDPDRPASERRIDDGYDEFHWSHDPARKWPTNEYRHWLRERGVEYEQTPVRESAYVSTSVPAEHHQTTWCVERAVEFVEEVAAFDAPWLYSVNVFDPHHPFDPPREYLQRYLDRLDDVPLPNYEPGELDDKPRFQRIDHEGAYGGRYGGDGDAAFAYPEMSDADHRLVRAAYWAMVELIDDQVERLLRALEATGQREETVVVFTSDHGEMLGDHGLYLKGPYFYEPAVRVPLIVSWPGRIQDGVDSGALVELVDLAPTLLDAAGVDRYAGFQGESLWPLLTGDGDPDDHRESVYCEFYDAAFDYDASFDSAPVAPFGTMVRTEGYKLVRMHGLDTGELYDLDDDPDERHNRWGDPQYVDAKTELLGTLADRMADTVDPLPVRDVPY